MDAPSQVGQVGQVIGKEAAFDAVDAEVEAVAAGSRGNGVGAGLLLAVAVLGHRGDELSGGEGKALKLIEDELEVIALGRIRKCSLCAQDVRYTAHGPRQFSLSKDEALKIGPLAVSPAKGSSGKAAVCIVRRWRLATGGETLGSWPGGAGVASWAGPRRGPSPYN